MNGAISHRNDKINKILLIYTSLKIKKYIIPQNS